MIIFNTDLDNTMIFSYKRDIGKNKICVEIYQGREVSFITPKTAELIKQISKKMLFVPTTTRTIEQYQRINLGINIEYALVCNGGILLKNGIEVPQWYEESLDLIKDCQPQLKLAENILEKDSNRSFEVRNISDLFIFTKSDNPDVSIANLEKNLDLSKMSVFANGTKVYAVPKMLSKGVAVGRLKKKLGADLTISAGDSEFDVPMVQTADISIIPPDFPSGNAILPGNIIKMSEDFGGVFSEFVLSKGLDIIGDLV